MAHILNNGIFCIADETRVEGEPQYKDYHIVHIKTHPRYYEDMEQTVLDAVQYSNPDFTKAILDRESAQDSINFSWLSHLEVLSTEQQLTPETMRKIFPNAQITYTGS